MKRDSDSESEIYQRASSYKKLNTTESDKNLNTVAPIQSITEYLCPPEGTRGTDFLGNDVRKQKENKNHNDLPESLFENVYKPDQLVSLDQLFSMNLMKNYSQVVSSLDIIHHEEFFDITGTIGATDPWTVSNHGEIELIGGLFS